MKEKCSPFLSFPQSPQRRNGHWTPGDKDLSHQGVSVSAVSPATPEKIRDQDNLLTDEWDARAPPSRETPEFQLSFPHSQLPAYLSLG